MKMIGLPEPKSVLLFRKKELSIALLLPYPITAKNETAKTNLDLLNFVMTGNHRSDGGAG
jgi:hypothetical protein